MLFVETCLSQPDRWNAKHKDRYLEDLKKCERSGPSANCHTGTVINVVISYQKGDLRVIDNLMDAARNNADYMEEGLGWFFNELLCQKPRTFLTAVAERRGKEHGRLLYLAAIGDSQNLGCLQMASLRQTLNGIAKDRTDKLSGLSEQTLAALDRNARSTPKTGDCFAPNFKFKSETEVAAMGPRELVEEEVQRDIHAPDRIEASHSYWVLTHKYLRKNAAAVLPILAEYMDAYDPSLTARCDSERFGVASEAAFHIDNGAVRLRGLKEGQTAISALERAVARMRAANTPTRGSHLELAAHHLKMQKRNSIHDGMMRDTLKARHGIVMSDDEFEKFIEFLVLLDPTYPSWNDSAAYSVPMLLKHSRRYFEAYEQFRGRR